jgi:hypothetical protein
MELPVNFFPVPSAIPHMRGRYNILVPLRTPEQSRCCKRLSSFGSGAADYPPRKNWTEPLRESRRLTPSYIGLQNHNPGAAVWFKDVSVRPLE